MPDIIKPQRLSLVDQVIESICKFIGDGTWEIGTTIPGELDLMEQFGVSRNTIREAIRSLAYSGVLESKQGMGTFVMSKSVFDASMFKRLKSARLSEVLEVRRLFETEIVSLAAERRSQEELDELERLRDERNNVVFDREAFVEADMKFHFQIVSMIGNHLLFDLYKSMMNFLEELISTYLIYTNNDVQQKCHNNLFKAIKEQDKALARSCVAELVHNEKKIFQEVGLIEV